MKNPRITTQSRQSLDARFENLRPAARFSPPVRGWIKAIREALGMTSAQLARRVKIKQPTLAALEQSEIKETIQLHSVEHSMQLEDQGVPAKDFEARIDALARDTNPRKLWDDA